MSTYLGIDIGTSSVKTILMDADQSILASASAELQVSRPKPGWSEQNPDDWWQAAEQTLDQLAASNAKEIAAVEGIGLSGQMHGATMLDGADQPLRPCMLWNDGRSNAQCEEIERVCTKSRQISGNLAMPGFTAPKVLWVKQHEPEVFDQTSTVLLPKDYVRLHLTGEKVSDMSDAAGTLWMNVRERRWSDELLAATGLSKQQMPRLVEGSDTSGQLREELAHRWGMLKRPVIAGGGGDNAASACGVGVVDAGAGFLSIGTSGVLFVSNETYSPNTEDAVHAFCHAVPDTWHQMGVVLSASASLDWLAGLLNESAADLTRALGDDLNAPSNVHFLPYLSGERTPHNDVTIRGNFYGIDHDTDRQKLTQSVLQGVTFAFQDCLSALQGAGASVDHLIAIGGGSQAKIWLKTIATTLNVPIQIPVAGELGAAFGAARLGVAAATDADPKSICVNPEITETIEPDRALASAYQDAWGHYRSIYPALKEAIAS
jgi:xylulokinase